MERQTIQIKEGDILQVEIIEQGEKGDGIAKTEQGFVLIIPKTIKDNKYEVKITKVKQKFAFAEVINRLEEE